jgi:hypothetical protein
MTEAYASWDRGQMQRRMPEGGQRSARAALLSILGLSLLCWLPLAVPLILLLHR